MIIVCQSCSSKYLLPESKVPPKPIKVQCPKCKAIFKLIPTKEKVAMPPQEGASVMSQELPSTPVEKPGAAVVSPQPQKKREKRRSGGNKEDRAKRLARVLVSDILCYNQEKRDQALIDGNLMAVLGEEIKKSWELYKEKVGPDLAGSTNYFKEALNEILADGQNVF
jgi:predicted Zn finger-like uncharacterized protein